MFENAEPVDETIFTAGITDSELVRRLVTGQAEAMDEIFNRYYRMVMSVALRIVRDSSEAQDVTQVVFTDFYRQAKLFDPTKGNLKTWLLQYAYGRSINRRQSLRVRKFYERAEFDELTAQPVADNRLFNLETPEAARLVDEILSSLGDRQRQVIEMVCFRGMTMAEIAAATGESLGNIQHLYYRGIEKLRTHLRNSGNGINMVMDSKLRNPLSRKLRAEKTEVEIVKARAL
jgi:RNA polymerase sigma-70 factor, ECF subfamily